MATLSKFSTDPTAVCSSNQTGETRWLRNSFRILKEFLKNFTTGCSSKSAICALYLAYFKTFLILILSVERQRNSPKIALFFTDSFIYSRCGHVGILKAKQKLGVTFNSDKLGGIDFTKFSKLSMCWPVLAGTMAWASS